jgi:hypothetical protein
MSNPEIRSFDSPSSPRSEFPGIFIFLAGGLAFMLLIVFGALYGEGYIVPWIKGKPEEMGKTVLQTPYPKIAEPNPKAGNTIDELNSVVLPAPKDDPALTVRSGLMLWLRGESVPAGTNSGDLVPIVPDGTNLRNDARQIYPVGRPRYAKAGLNGKDALYFDGKDSFFYYENNFGISPVTIYAVWSRPQDGGAAFQRLYSSGAFAEDYQNAKSAPAGQPALNGAYFNAFEPKGGESVDASGQPMGPIAEPQLHTFVSAAPLDLRRFMIGRLNQGPVQFFSGNIAEFMLFNRPLAPEEQKKVESYLRTKYVLK